MRVALAGTTVSPGIFETVALLGREETLARIDARSLGAASEHRRSTIRRRAADRGATGITRARDRSKERVSR